MSRTFLRYSYPENRNFNRVFSDVSVVLREITHTISDSIVTGSPVESEKVGVIYLSTNNRDSEPGSVFTNHSPERS